MNNSSTASKLDKLREKMQEMKVDYYYVPSSDAHRNEYVPTCWQRRAWISQFTGSAGDALIGLDEAYLWTDPRYFLQADMELDKNYFTLMKQMQGTPPVDKWLAEKNKAIHFATDPRVITINQSKKLMSALAKNNGKLVAIDNNLIDAVWDDQPQEPKQAIHIYPQQYAGKTTVEKLKLIRAALEDHSVDAIVITMLDEIAWTLNIRGTDVAYNPLVISYAIVTQDSATLFVDPAKITDEVKQVFQQEKISTKTYSEFSDALAMLDRVWLDPNTTSLWVEDQLSHADILLHTSPIPLLKAIKNKTEIAGMIKAHEIDAIAVIRFLHWLETSWTTGVTELSAAKKLEAFRREDKRCLDLSFDTISGFGSHGAVIHYRVDEKSNIPIDDSSLYLLDSGGQYLDGTTDITRTVHLGEPTLEQKKHYTLVLKGHLALRHIVFPDGTCGEHINTVAHAPLWQHGLDFSHGTGHGVGCYLCVHEGPQFIASRNSNVTLQPGMIVSNEPGVYFDNQYGIRIENLCLIEEKIPAAKSQTGHGPFYGLQDLTLVPYCRKLIDSSLLTATEIEQINQYHAEIAERLRGQLEQDASTWLLDATKPI